MSYAATFSKNSGPPEGIPASFGSCNIETSGTANVGSLKLNGTSVTIVAGLAGTAMTQTYSTATTTVAAATAAALTLADGVGTNDGTVGAITADASVIAAIQEISAQITKLVADDLVLRKLINQIIDDLQVAGIET